MIEPVSLVQSQVCFICFTQVDHDKEVIKVKKLPDEITAKMKRSGL